MKISSAVLGLAAFACAGGITLLSAADPPAPVISNDPASLGRQEIELGGRFVFLKQLVERHQKRAQLARSTNNIARSEWETALAKDFSDEAAQAAAQLEVVTRQRLAAEQTNQAASPKLLSLTSDETAYVNKIGTLLWALDQDSLSLSETGRVLTAQLQTNTGPEEIARISEMLMQQNMSLRQVEKERQSLELEQLRFNILKRR